MFRSQQHGEHVCYRHSLHFVQMLVARFPILFISIIDYADHMPCMNCREEEINQEEARMKPAYALQIELLSTA